MSLEVENLNLEPLFKHFGFLGQFEGHENVADRKKFSQPLFPKMSLNSDS